VQLDSVYADVQNKLYENQDKLNALKNQNESLSSQKKALVVQVLELNKQIDGLTQNNVQALTHLKDLSDVTKAQAESIKKAMENMSIKDAYIKNFQSLVARNDSLNMVLVMKLNGAIGNYGDKDINIKVNNGWVYIDISNKLLFKSGGYDVAEKAKDFLGKIANVLNNQPEINFMVEGGLDTGSYKNNILIDDWVLSAKRATSIVRILQNQYSIDPKRMTATGRNQYIPIPITEKGTPEYHQAANTKTRIIILPQLDQLFRLLEKK